jgi:DNA-binding CsgD family transcriptional regulator
MLSKKSVIIISPNQLQCIGLKNILEEYFNPGSIYISNVFENTISNKIADFIFMPSDMYLAHNGQVNTLKSKTIIFTQYETERIQGAPDMLNITLPPEELIEQLRTIFQKNLSAIIKDEQEELSSRETEVLKLVAKGLQNKQIADKLSISLHTVISHRKNITRKLGIKTVSGLTVYALLNGLITSKDINK